LHRIRALMDEVFGPKNFISIVTIKKTAYQAAEHLGNVTDYLVWFAKHLETLKTNPVYVDKADIESADLYKYTVLPTGERRLLKETDSEALNAGRYRLISAISQGASSSPQPFTFNGE